VYSQGPGSRVKNTEKHYDLIPGKEREGEQDALEAWHETLLIERFHDFENPIRSLLSRISVGRHADTPSPVI
jgi:hypothetical protein